MKKKCKCNCKNNKPNLDKNDKCEKYLDLYPNTYIPQAAIENLDILEKVFLGMKSALIHYLNNITSLYMNLAESQEPDKLTLVQNLERFKLLQQALLNEMKTTAEGKFTDMTNAVPCIISTESIEYFSKKNGNTPEDYFKGQKNLSSKKLYVKFNDGTTIEFISVPSFLFNLDKFNDSLTLKISEATSHLASSNMFQHRGTDKESHLFINADTNDGYLYKDVNGEYHPDRNDAYNYDENIKSSVGSVLEFYESIINTGNRVNIGHLEGLTFNSGSDMHIVMNTIDIQLRKIKLAKRMICLRVATN
jgi:hypothetical protein